MRSVRVLFCLLFVIVGLLFMASKPSFAQISPTSATTTTNSFAAPNMDPDVPLNQHTFAQSTTIEVLSAIHCLLIGVDPINPTQGCLGINPETKRLGMSKPVLDEYGKPEIGGLVGISTGLITSTYQPIASTGTYTRYISDKFGIVPKAYAAVAPCDPAKSGYGLCGLQPIIGLWETVRNIAYVLLTLAFVFIGVGIMLRIKIDPRTVMTIQNQIPKVIVSIILITLSYAISAMLIDLMWVTTYAGSYLLTATHDPDVGNCTDKTAGPEKLSEKATSTILQTPITYFNQIFARCSEETGFLSIGEGNDRDGGFHVMTKSVADSAGNTIGNVARSLMFDENDLETKCKWYHPIKCAKKGVANFLAVLVSAVAQIIIFVILVINLFKIWFNLLKAYIYTLAYVILAPIIIVFGLLPTKPMGFESWIRRLFVNIAIFPLTVFLLIAARLLLDIYSTASPNQFVPPLVGNPSSTNFGALMAFGVLLIAPTIQTILREKMGVKNIGTPGIVGAGIAAGAAVVGAPVGRAMKHLNRYDARSGDKGALAVLKRKTGEKIIGAGSRVPILGSMAERGLASRRLIERQGTVHGEGGFEKTIEAEREAIRKERGERVPFRQRRRNKNGAKPKS